MDVVYNTLNEEIEISRVHCWSGSLVTLAWIKAVDKELKAFVENRVIAIRKKVPPNRLNYCNTSDNPADIITRFNNCVLNKTLCGGVEPNS